MTYLFPTVLKNKFSIFSPTGNDEMCNFYMMYWVDGDQLLDEPICRSAGPPYYYFQHDRVYLFLFDRIFYKKDYF